MTLPNSAAIGSLTVRQSDLTDAWQPPRKYDLVLSTLSWEERRSTGLRIASGKLEELTVLRFAPKTAELARIKAEHLAEIEGLFRKVNVIDLEASVEVRANSQKLEEWLRDEYVKTGRPLRLLIDISCMPKSYLLFLMGLGFTRDFVSCLDCIYVGGHYDLTTDAQSAEGPVAGPRALVSEGEWRSYLVPYLTAREYLPGSRDLVVAMGGELSLSLPFIERVEPRRLELIFIKETAPSGRRRMLNSERSALEELMGEPNSHRIDCRLGDIIGVAVKAVAFARASQSSGVSAMAIGAKSHALALGLAALSESNVEVVCRTPTSYRISSVFPSGKMYFYEIEDRFEPCSYIDLP